MTGSWDYNTGTLPEHAGITQDFCSRAKCSDKRFFKRSRGKGPRATFCGNTARETKAGVLKAWVLNRPKRGKGGGKGGFTVIALSPGNGELVPVSTQERRWLEAPRSHGQNNPILIQ